MLTYMSLSLAYICVYLNIFFNKYLVYNNQQVFSSCVMNFIHHNDPVERNLTIVHTLIAYY